MNEADLAKLYRYEELKIQAKEIEAEIKKLNRDILPLIPADEALGAKFGKFEIRSRQSWAYTDEVMNLEETLKGKKAEEVARGVAIPTTSSSLYYVSNKKKEDDKLI